jgi:serine/threonine protein kinase
MVGKAILHYKILEKLGEGGMGVVYKAEDTKLKRDVAIKFLPRQIAASNEERERFKIEAQSAAALNHPNIATIYAIEEHADEMFIVMEYIEGRELKEIVGAYNHTPLLQIDDIIDYATQIASGLQAAHKKGITHRDIKSSNIMITEEGQVKIMDFGLAKVGGGAGLTRDQSTLGTAAYMSPEQARGEEVDHRTDIWAFGVVLYEMLTGQMPFQGDYEQAVIYSILNEEPLSPLDHQPNLSEGLLAIIQRALQKEPEKRYQKASEISDEIGGLKTQSSDKEHRTAKPPSSAKRKAMILSAVGALLVIAVMIGFWLPEKASSGKNSIAVLPLANSSGDSEQDYFSDGMTDALISNLGTVKALKVISRTSVMRYKSTTKSIGEIANELNVSHIVEGSVLRIEDRVRITARLIDAGKDEQIWGHTYEQELADILMLQSEVARAIASEIEVTITPQETARLTHSRLINPKAFEAYLKGRYQWNKRTKEGFEKSIRLLNEAVAIEPEYALAYAGLADNYNLAPSYLSTAPHEAYPIAKQFAQQALSLDDQIAEAHNSLAWVSYIYDWDWQKAERAFQRAISLNPGYAAAHQWYAWYLFCVGRMDEVAEVLKFSYNE